MGLQFTRDGVEIDTFNEIYDRLAQGLRDIYGQDIDLSQNTPDGQRLGIFVKELMDMQSFGQLLYSQLDIDFSFGSFQDVLLKLVGISKRSPSKSQVDVTVVSDRVQTLASGYTISDGAGTNWETTTEVDLTVGNNTVTFFSERVWRNSSDSQFINHADHDRSWYHISHKPSSRNSRTC